MIESILFGHALILKEKIWHGHVLIVKDDKPDFALTVTEDIPCHSHYRYVVNNIPGDQTESPSAQASQRNFR